MSLYVLVGDDRKSSINEMCVSCQKVTPAVSNQTNLVELMLETDTNNAMNHGWQTATFVSVGLKYLEGSACALSTII